MQLFISTINLAGNYNTHGPGERQTLISNSNPTALFLCIENHCFLSVEIEAVQLKERFHKMCFHECLPTEYFQNIIFLHS